jgi:hypothetical protein
MQISILKYAVIGTSLLLASAGAARADIFAAFIGVSSDDQRIFVARMRSRDLHWEGPFQATGGSNARVGIFLKNTMSPDQGYMLVARGIDRDTQLYWQQSMDGESWTFRQAVNGPADAASGPTLFFWGQQLTMAYKSNHENILQSQSFDGNQTWSAPANFPNASQLSTSSESPGVAEDGFGDVLVVAKGATNDKSINYWFGSTANGFPAAPDQAPGETSSQPAVISIGQARFLVAVKGANDDADTIYWNIFQMGQVPPYGPWTTVGEVGTTHGPALARDNDDTVYMAWKGVVGDFRLFFSKFTGQGWQAPRSGGVAVQDTLDCTCGSQSGPALAGDSSNPFAGGSPIKPKQKNYAR